MTPYQTYFNWSGGKDSALALYHALQNPQYEIQKLLTSINTAHDRVSMHGVRTALLQAQAATLQLPLQTIELPEQVSMVTYNEILLKTVSTLKREGFTHTIFGDIFLEDLRAYRETQLQAVGIQAHFPLWKRDTTALIHEFLDLGFKTIVVCVKSDLLDVSFAGRIIDKDFIKELPKNVDPCGENGEFHTFVFDGPIFEKPIPFTIGEKVFRTYESPKSKEDDCFVEEPAKPMGFWFCDLLPL